MIEKKFRIWNKSKKSMEYSDNYKCLSDFFQWNDYQYHHNIDDSQNNYVLMQYTGEKTNDKNQDIYEKDILKISMGSVIQNEYFLVEDLRDFYFLLHHNDSYLRITDYELIGNVYENPEIPVEYKEGFF